MDNYEKSAREIMKRGDRILAERAENPNIANEKDQTVVSGVEIYRRPVWKALMPAVAVTMLAVGTVTGGMQFFKNHSKDHDDLLAETTDNTTCEITEPQEAVPEITTETTTVPQYMELQLHEPSAYVGTMEEADALLEEHSYLMPWNGRYGVDTAHYADLLLSDGYDIGSLEAKSYIYHIMLKSWLYFNSVSGTLNISNTDDHYVTHNTGIDFRADLNAWESYSKVYDIDMDIVTEEEYQCFGKLFMVYPEEKMYQESYFSKSEQYLFIEDNYVHIDTAPPDYGITGYGISFGCGGMAQNYLCPYQYAGSRMRDFDNWQITGFEEVNGRTAAVISGSLTGVCDYEIKTDIYTGIMLELTENDCDGKNEHTYFTFLEIDVPIEPVIFDAKDYEEMERH